MLSFEARVERGVAVVTRWQAGAPPDPIPAEDAVHLFSFMRSGLGQFAFTSTGPLTLPASKPGA
jgi:hypothetical protein